MAAISATQTATLTPPSSSHGNANGFQWDFVTAPNGKPEDQYYGGNSSYKNKAPIGNHRAPLATQHGNAASHYPEMPGRFSDDSEGANGHFSQPQDQEDTPDTMIDGSLDDTDDDEYVKTADGFVHSKKRINGDMEWSAEDSKWIHRDKLAKIENEELQAAGIILPRPRSRSRGPSRGPRRDRSESSHRKLGGENSMRSRNHSTHALDLGSNDDGADGDPPSRPMTSSRIPVPKKVSGSGHSREGSTEDDKDRRFDASSARSRSNSTTLKSLDPSPTFKSTPIKKAATEPPSKKTTPPGGTRKPSGPTKTIPPEARGRPKPKGKNGANGSNGRPNTRSGERELSGSMSGSRQMEGEPPWMISAYKPDPRLPPDQQLLPTVAKRLAQEKWEQEGKFGNVYDKDFRPLTDEGFLVPPPASSTPALQSTSPVDIIIEPKVDSHDEWPLRSPEAPKSPASIGRSSTYSTMPRIQDKVPSHTSAASPKEPQQPTIPEQLPQPVQPVESRPTNITRVPDVEKAESMSGRSKKKEGCGCCVVM
ncbi:hypothetical protein BD289DRAFT_486100 [Coniella lustricola]|uniref:TeaA receptor TeaR n=1 Tax=Coniella lustricola TaxID=2025994 RepID=A0A2T2ZW91_9PEZI|nr:hypothetical protein BD289DRAFT_486100 [Coniella lustricola]